MDGGGRNLAIWQSMWVEALSGQQAKHVKLYLDSSRLKKRELLIAMESHQWGARGGGISASEVPDREYLS